MAEKTAKVPIKKEEGAAPAGAEGWDLLTSLHDEADRLFREFSRHWPAGPLSARGRALLAPFGDLPSVLRSGAPAIDIVDLEKEIQVRAELPGMEEKDIEVEISDDVLTIRGEKKEEREEGEKEGRYYLSERHYGSFERSLRIPDTANSDKASARFGKGVLTITFPKTKEALRKPKKVAVKSE